MHIWELKDRDGRGFLDGIKFTADDWHAKEYVYYDFKEGGMYDEGEHEWSPELYVLFASNFLLYDESTCPHCGR